MYGENPRDTPASQRRTSYLTRPPVRRRQRRIWMERRQSCAKPCHFNKPNSSTVDDCGG